MVTSPLLSRGDFVSLQPGQECSWPGGQSTRSLGGVALFLGVGGQPFHHYLPDTRLRTGPQQLSWNHSTLMVGPTAVFLRARARPSTSEEGAGGAGL